MANIQDQKILIGKMDRESSPETMNPYDYMEAHNIRNVGNDESDRNYLTNVDGTIKITTNLPTGENRCIGSKEFELVSKAYFIRYNSEGHHQIVEFDFDLSLETVIFENITDTGGIDILNWTSETYFSDIRLAHRKFLILNNSVNEIYNINIEDFKNKEIGKVFTEKELLLIKPQPLVPPKVNYINNPTKTTNALRGNLFQFRVQNVFSDFKESAWGTVSKRIVPSNEPADGQGQSVSQNNGVIVTIKIEQDNLTGLNIAVRTGTNNWLLVSEQDIKRIKSLPDTDIAVDNESNLIGTNTEAYNPVTKEYKFIFYNEGLYPILDQVEVENPYDSIPQKVETVEIVNGNLLAVGGITEGYNKPIIDNVDLTITEYAPNLSSSVTGGTDFDVDYSDIIAINRRRFFFKGTPKEGDTVYFKYRLSNQVTWQTPQPYVVTQSDEISGMGNTLRSVANHFSGSSAQMSEWENRAIVMHPAFSDLVFKTEFYVVRKDIGVLSTQSINTLKSNSSYQLALAYSDSFGRYFPLVTDDRFIVKTKSLTETQGLLSQVNWTIQEQAPEGAVSYQWLLSENQKYQKSIYLTGKIDTTETDQNYIGIEVKSLERFIRNENESQINYSFTKGDKVVFMYTTDGNSNSVSKWFRYPFIELDIVGFEIKKDPNNEGLTKYLLKVRRTDLLNESGGITYLDNKDIMMELYTPKKRDIEQSRTFFYEIGEQYPIIDGKHSVTSGGIREGDWYYRGRLYESNVETNKGILYEVEDPNFSDNYESKYWSAGRGRIASDEEGRVEKLASIRYSDEYIYGSKYNGLSRFYLERIYGETGGQTTSRNGAIKKLETRDSSLVCIQEFKVGVIPVYKSIIFDNTDTSLVADSGKIFGSIQYRVGNYGCGEAKESITTSRDGNIYFFDSNNCVPIRDSISGLSVIDINMTSYFTKYAREAKNLGARFIGYYDAENKEYNLTIEDRTGRLTTIYFNTTDVEYRDNFVPLPNMIGIIQPQHGTLTLNGYMATYTPNYEYIGSDISSFTFNNTQKNVKYLVEAGYKTPQPFLLGELFYQPTGVLVDSNVITVQGINTKVQISVVNGMYRIGSGQWTTDIGVVQNGDQVQVRHTTASTVDTEVITTLTIGNTVGTFKSKTVPQNVDPSQHVNISHSVIEPNPQTGTRNSYGVQCTISHPLASAYQSSGSMEYIAYGSVYTTNFSLTVSSGDTSNDTGYIVTNADPIDWGVNGVITSSSIQNGDLVMCEDGVQRIANVSFSF